MVVVEFKGLAVDTEDTEIIHYREGEVPRSITGLTTVRYRMYLTNYFSCLRLLDQKVYSIGTLNLSQINIRIY